MGWVLTMDGPLSVPGQITSVGISAFLGQMEKRAGIRPVHQF
jgi:hypothetical protein